jgi:HlyD family secretion protein
MEKKQNTDEFLDIIEKIPSKIITIISISSIGLILILIFLSIKISYPDVISGSANVQLSKNTVLVNMPNTGKIKFKVKPKAIVKTGQILAEIENNTKYEDVCKLKYKLESWEQNRHSSKILKFKTKYFLGELNVSYINFLNGVIEYENYLKNKSIDISIANLKREINSQNSYKKELIKQCLINKKRLILHKKNFNRDSVLYIKELISEFNFDKTKQAFLEYNENHVSLKMSLLKCERNIESLQEDVVNLNIQNKNHLSTLTTKLNQLYANLLSNIELWEINYLIISPIDGTIEFLDFINQNSFMQHGQPIFCVIGEQEEKVKFKVMLAEGNVGKVKIGNKVIIKLNDYAYNEYGSLHGIVSDIFKTKVKTEDGSLTLMQVDLLNDGKTNNGNTINFINDMSAQIDVVVERRNLAERIFSKLRKLSKE